MGEPPIRPIPSEFLPEDKRFAKLKYRKVLFKPPFTCVALGAIGAGKTSFAYSLINDHYGGYFDEVIVLSGTIDSKEAWEGIRAKRVIFMNYLNEAELKEYLNQLEEDKQERTKKGKFPVRVCLVMDDMVFDGFSKNRTGGLEKLIMTCRHLFVSMIFMLQHSKQISAAMRNQIMYWVIFRLTAMDLEKVAKELGDTLNPEQFKEMYGDIQKLGRREFLIVDVKGEVEDRFRHRFTSIIDQKLYIN